MAQSKKVIVIGSGFAGQTAALYLGDALGKDHEVTVITRTEEFIFIPSLVWVGIDRMSLDKIKFPLAPVFEKFNINYFHGQVTDIYPDDEYLTALNEKTGELQKFEYDYLLNATGPKLNFEGTPGLGPHAGLTQSICTPTHAIQSRDRYLESVKRMQQGEKQHFIIGTGHGMATCQGAAFEYITNIHKDLERRGIRDKATIKWLSNEPALGDFGIDGISVAQGKQIRTSEEFISTIFQDYGIDWQVETATKSIDGNTINFETLQGQEGSEKFDFAMLIPQFLGNGMIYHDKDGNDITSKVANPGGFVLVDAVYGKPYDELKANPEYWPATYQSPVYPNIYAAGISFAPPGPISRPQATPNGTPIAPAPPRTGMVSGIIGRLVAKNIIDNINGKVASHSERMTEMYAACIASMGDSIWDGSAAVIIAHPIVPDWKKYPVSGRDMFVSNMEMGLSGAWMKRMIHMTFNHKLRGRIGWSLIPE
ncbi:MAG: FAD-dependent oxidoreductase [Candidatus Marinimicrobia bacterium]|nr:FAD-dependent oxidoreductase [Candidatus Neomarinimicrobiota bacterium]